MRVIKAEDEEEDFFEIILDEDELFTISHFTGVEAMFSEGFSENKTLNILVRKE